MTNDQYKATYNRLIALIDVALENGDLTEYEHGLAMEFIERADVPVTTKSANLQNNH